MNNSRIHIRTNGPWGAALLAGMAALAAVLFWAPAGGVPSAQAQGPTCPGTAGSADAEDQQAFVDIGEGNVATFVCIETSAGMSQPVTANGTASDGCFVVEGLGTWLVAVYQDTPSGGSCPDLVRISAGTAGQAPSPTPAATASPSPAATPPASPTAQPTMTMPRPPAAGTGLESASDGPAETLAIALGAAAIAIAGGGMLAAYRRR